MNGTWQHPRSYVLRSLVQAQEELMEELLTTADDDRRVHLIRRIERLDDEINAREGL